MVFNHFLWNLYRDSQEGRAAIEYDISEFVEPNVHSQKAAFAYPMDHCEVLNDEFLENGAHWVEDVNLRQKIKEYADEQAAK